YVGTNEKGIGHYEIVMLDGFADDFSDADGVNFLSFGQAQLLAQDKVKPSGPLTVRKAMEDYVAFLAANGQDTNDTERRSNVHILPTLGHLEVSALKSATIRNWLAALAKAPTRIRTSTNATTRRTKPIPADPEAIRKRRNSANRILAILKAALNHAFDEEHVKDNSAWGRRVKPFREVNVARLRYLSIAEAQRLLNACEGELRSLVRGALESGARYGELKSLLVSDFNSDAGTLHIRKSKTGKERHIVLTEEGWAFFSEITAGRAGDDFIFLRADGEPWGPSHQSRPVAEANERAKIRPPITFHGLRHTWASHAVMNGTPLMVVATNLGHSDVTMVVKHYGHLAPSYVVDA